MPGPMIGIPRLMPINEAFVEIRHRMRYYWLVVVLLPFEGRTAAMMVMALQVKGEDRLV